MKHSLVLSVVVALIVGAGVLFHWPRQSCSAQSAAAATAQAEIRIKDFSDSPVQAEEVGLNRLLFDVPVPEKGKCTVWFRTEVNGKLDSKLSSKMVLRLQEARTVRVGCTCLNTDDLLPPELQKKKFRLRFVAGNMSTLRWVEVKDQCGYSKSGESGTLKPGEPTKLGKFTIGRMVEISDDPDGDPDASPSDRTMAAAVKVEIFVQVDALTLKELERAKGFFENSCHEFTEPLLARPASAHGKGQLK